jgi:hypothetical protein
MVESSLLVSTCSPDSIFHVIAEGIPEFRSLLALNALEPRSKLDAM